MLVLSLHHVFGGRPLWVTGSATRCASEQQSTAALGGARLQYASAGWNGFIALDDSISAYFTRANEVCVLCSFDARGDGLEALRCAESARSLLIEMCGQRISEVTLASLGRRSAEVQIVMRKCVLGTGKIVAAGGKVDMSAVFTSPEQPADDRTAKDVRAANDITSSVDSSVEAAAVRRSDALSESIGFLKLPALQHTNEGLGAFSVHSVQPCERVSSRGALLALLPRLCKSSQHHDVVTSTAGLTVSGSADLRHRSDNRTASMSSSASPDADDDDGDSLIDKKELVPKPDLVTARTAESPGAVAVDSVRNVDLARLSDSQPEPSVIASQLTSVTPSSLAGNIGGLGAPFNCCDAEVGSPHSPLKTAEPLEAVEQLKGGDTATSSVAVLRNFVTLEASPPEHALEVGNAVAATPVRSIAGLSAVPLEVSQSEIVSMRINANTGSADAGGSVEGTLCVKAGGGWTIRPASAAANDGVDCVHCIMRMSSWAPLCKIEAVFPPSKLEASAPTVLSLQLPEFQRSVPPPGLLLHSAPMGSPPACEIEFCFALMPHDLRAQLSVPSTFDAPSQSAAKSPSSDTVTLHYTVAPAFVVAPLLKIFPSYKQSFALPGSDEDSTVAAAAPNSSCLLQHKFTDVLLRVQFHPSVSHYVSGAQFLLQLPELHVGSATATSPPPAYLTPLWKPVGIFVPTKSHVLWQLLDSPAATEKTSDSAVVPSQPAEFKCRVPVINGGCVKEPVASQWRGLQCKANVSVRDLVSNPLDTVFTICESPHHPPLQVDSGHLPPCPISVAVSNKQMQTRLHIITKP